jgi:hypothetical protein
MEKIYTIGQLKEAIKYFNDNDELAIEIHEDSRGEGLYIPYIDVIHGVVTANGTFVSEVRLCI